MTQRSRFLPFWLTWQLLAVLVLLLAPSQLWLTEPLWATEDRHALQVMGLAVAYGIAALFVGMGIMRKESGRTRMAPAHYGTALVTFSVAVVLFAPSYSRGLLLVGSVLFLLLALSPFVLGKLRGPAALVLGGASIALVGVGLAGQASAEDHADGLPVAFGSRSTHYHRVALRYFQHPEPTIWGGGLDRLGDDFLLVTGEGAFYRYEQPGDSLVGERLALDAPLNREDFEATVDPTVNTDWFRVSGLLTQELEDGIRVVVSHHYWNTDEGCYVLRFSETVLNDPPPWESTSGAVNAPRPWRTLHDTRPCLPYRPPVDGVAGQDRSGGRIAALGDSALLVTVGDHEFDGWNAEDIYPQDRNTDYGKTLVIPLDGGEVRIFTLGHRNPQGLHVEETGEIWLSEHGPRAGDELNLLVQDANYGWPFETHGTQYGERTWPLRGATEPETTFVPPVFAWIPSIAPSNLVAVTGSHFPEWRGDLLLATLRAETLFRLHREEGQVVYAEPIRVDRRIRDLAEGADGRLLLWTDGGSLVSLERTEDDERESVIRICTTCHAIDEPGQGLGPDLAGIVGAEIASRDGFQYSDALESLGGTWTEERLDEFLADPSSFAPGTSMAVAGIEEAAQREIVIEYLKALGESGNP